MENKRYYWLKLQEDFFGDDTIDYIESQPNGEKYVLFYLKLCLKALKSEGKLIKYVGNMLMPYDDKGLAKLTHTDIDTVRCAVTIFMQIGLLEKLETGEIFLTQINELVGTETESAKRVRKHRLLQSNKKTLQCNNDVISCNTEIEIEKEKEKDIETPQADFPLTENQPKTKKHKNGPYQNVLLSDTELMNLCEDLGADKAKAVIDNFSELKEMKGYKYKSDYLAIRKWGISAYQKQDCKPNKADINYDYTKDCDNLDNMSF